MNKKTIAVYGDSFANYENNSQGISWVNLLEQDHTVTNFGFPGNSIYQCYKTILSNHGNYDYNIFIIPVGGRFFSKALQDLLAENPKSFKNWYNNLPSLELVKLAVERDHLDYTNPARILKIIDSVYTYWTEWKDNEFDDTTNNLMLNDIKKINNILLIDTRSIDNNLGLSAISMWELDQLGFSEKYPNQFGTINKNASMALRDSRKNHLSDENSFILYKKIVDAINTNSCDIKLSYTDFVKPSKDIESYIGWHNI
jgi:hypothetical protein